MWRTRFPHWFALVFVAAAVLRIALGVRPGLWADEIFSLAMATGHSLEHAAEAAVPALGDFVEPREGRLPREWDEYLSHGVEPAGVGRVVRAVYLSDTNPPGYYLLLWAWTRLLGTSDAALRFFSVAAALAAMPLLWALARYMGGIRAAVFACLLYAAAPAAMYYAAEGRMYSLTWLLGLGLAWTSIRVRQRASVGRVLTWAVIGAAGLLTHYFFLFVWAACAFWLLAWPGRASRGGVLLAAGVTMLIVAPWFAQIPATLAQWRVTSGWVDSPLTVPQLLRAPIRLARSAFAVGGNWGWEGATTIIDRLAMLVFVVVGALQLRAGLAPLFSRRRRLLWLWFAASIAGILAFDLIRGTSAALNERYALLGLPAAVVLLGIAFARIPTRIAATATVMILFAWSTAFVSMLSDHPRRWQPFSTIAAQLEAELEVDDIVVVQSIPSGVLGLARYLERPIPVASWVEQLGTRRFPDDIERLTANVCRAALVKVHLIRPESPVENWLRERGRLYAEQRLRTGSQLHYEFLFFRFTDGDDKRGRECPA